MEQMLKDMGGRKSRKKVVRKACLIEIGYEMLQKFEGIRGSYGTHGQEKIEQLRKSVREHNIDVSASELTNTVFELSKFESDDFMHEWIGKETLGMYTGILLELFTEQEKSRGKKAEYHIDGQGIEFDYLFTGASRIGRVLIENFRGNNIANMIGSGDRIAIVNCSGLDLGHDIARTKKMERTYIINCESNRIGCRTGWFGEKEKTGVMFLANNTFKDDRPECIRSQCLESGGSAANLTTAISLNCDGTSFEYAKADLTIIGTENWDDRYGFTVDNCGELITNQEIRFDTYFPKTPKLTYMAEKGLQRHFDLIGIELPMMMKIAAGMRDIPTPETLELADTIVSLYDGTYA